MSNRRKVKRKRISKSKSTAPIFIRVLDYVLEIVGQFKLIHFYMLILTVYFLILPTYENYYRPFYLQTINPIDSDFFDIIMIMTHLGYFGLYFLKARNSPKNYRKKQRKYFWPIIALIGIYLLSSITNKNGVIMVTHAFSHKQIQERKVFITHKGESNDHLACRFRLYSNEYFDETYRKNQDYICTNKEIYDDLSEDVIVVKEIILKTMVSKNAVSYDLDSIISYHKLPNSQSTDTELKNSRD